MAGIVLAPPAMTEAGALAMVSDLQARGMFLSAHDAAMAAIARGMPGNRLRHLAVLTLARSGATSSALALWRALDLAKSNDSEIAGLHPRLLKDIARNSRNPNDAAAAAAGYLKLWQRYGGGWHGVNAAAMALLAGDSGRSRLIAEAVLSLPDKGDYWSAATQAEAFVLLGQMDAAARWLVQAEQRAGTDLSCRATTRKQLRWEADLLAADPKMIDLLKIPETIHYCGMIPGDDADEAALRTCLGPLLRPVGFGFGALAAGADIVIAEMLLDQGADVTAVLPFPPEQFVEMSVRPAGEGWVARYRACLDRVRLKVLDAAYNDDLDYTLSSRRAMGLTRLHSMQLDSKCWQLAIWDGVDSGYVAGTSTDVAAWRKAGLRTVVVESPWSRRKLAQVPESDPGPMRSAKAVLFGDLPRFSALDDAGLLAFYNGPLMAMGQVVNAAAPLYRNAWGDAVQLVFQEPQRAVSCAFQLREAFAASSRIKAGASASSLPDSMLPRLALDYGGLHSVFDAVQQVEKFAGRTMTQAARIEPITPPGSIYATEAFACEFVLALDAAIACDYAGQVPLAKSFGALPLYAVRKAGSLVQPQPA